MKNTSDKFKWLAAGVAVLIVVIYVMGKNNGNRTEVDRNQIGSTVEVANESENTKEFGTEYEIENEADADIQNDIVVHGEESVQSEDMQNDTDIAEADTNDEELGQPEDMQNDTDIVESDANDEESERTENTQNEVANNEQSEQIMAEEVADNGESVQSEDTQNESENSFLDSLGYAQVVVVDSNGSRADVAMYEKTNGVWNQILSTSGYVGSQGVGEASEYTTRTPQGVYSLTFPFGVKSNPGTSLSYLQVDDNDYWVDDTDSAFYNKYVRTDSPYTEWNSAEHLIEEPVAYAYALFIGYNTQGAYGKGSCFFLHCSTGAPTAGCVAIPQEDMIFILQNIGTDCGIAIY